MIDNLLLVYMFLFNDFITLMATQSNTQVIRTNNGKENEIFSEFGKCEHGELSDHKVWNKNKPLFLQYDDDTRISCLEVTGHTSTELGGLMDSKLKLKCLSVTYCEIKVFTQPLTKCTPLNASQEYVWPNRNSLQINFTDDLIVCMEIIGSYQILSGGIGFDYVNVRCISNNCVAKIYKGNIQRCEKGRIVLIQTWTSHQNFLFDGKKIQILCMEIKGRYQTLSGTRRNEDIDIKCLSRICEVTLFADTNYESDCIITNYNINKIWNNSKPIELKFELNKIMCFIVDGKYELYSGGLYQNYISIACISKKNCEITIYLEKSIESHPSKSRSIRTKTTALYETQKPKIKQITNKCVGHVLFAREVWNISAPLTFISSKVITCLDGEGDYEIISGGIYNNSVVVQCHFNNCTLEFYSDVDTSFKNTDNCTNFSLYLRKKWRKASPLILNSNVVIECFKINGRFNILSGNIGDKTIIVECLDDNCVIDTYTSTIQENTCKFYKLFLKEEWTNISPLVINLRNKTKIDCFTVDGNYRLITGGIGTYSLIMECISKKCTIEIYGGKKNTFKLVSSVESCNGLLAEEKCWDKLKPLNLILTPTQEINCINISGGYKILSGGIGESFMEIECYEITKDCCIVPYYINIVDTEKKSLISSGNCSYGKREIQKQWDGFTIQNIELEKNVKIICYNAVGKQNLVSGGTGTNYLKLDCQDENGCLVDVFTVRSEAHVISRYEILFCSLFIKILYNNNNLY